MANHSGDLLRDITASVADSTRRQLSWRVFARGEKRPSMGSFQAGIPGVSITMTDDSTPSRCILAAFWRSPVEVRLAETRDSFELGRKEQSKPPRRGYAARHHLRLRPPPAELDHVPVSPLHHAAWRGSTSVSFSIFFHCENISSFRFFTTAHSTSRLAWFLNAASPSRAPSVACA